MNKEYVVEFSIGNYFIGNYLNVSMKILAENNELALNQALGMLHGEWVNLVDIDGNSIRVRSNKVYALRCYGAVNVDF